MGIQVAGSMYRRYPFLLCATLVLFCPAHSYAQVKDGFVQALIEFANAANEDVTDNGAALTAAIDAMAQGLAAWDAALARMESGLASEIGAAPPPVAARMRTALGAAYLERGRLDDALKQFDAAATHDPQFADVHVLRGLALESANRRADAATAYRTAWQRQPDNLTSAYRALRSGGTGSGALVDEVTKALSNEVERGSTPGDKKAVGFADARLLDEASVGAPILLPAAFNDAVALLAQARYEDAIASLKASVPASLEAVRDEHSRLVSAATRMESRDAVGARTLLEEATRALPRSALSHWRLGRLQLALGDEAGALRSFQTAAALPLLGGGAHLYASIGRIHHNQLELAGATVAYSRRVDLTPNDVAAHIDLGDVYRAQDRLDEALAEYSIAALLDATNVRALVTTAQIHAAAGRDESAVKLLRRAVALDASHLEARYALSRALMRLGLTEDARRELQVFEQLQQKAMQDERRRFEENQIRIDETLKRGEQREPVR
jgi:tetratricopeptide (TPR) repeat protein